VTGSPDRLRERAGGALALRRNSARGERTQLLA